MNEVESSSSSSQLEYKRMGTSQESSFKADEPPKITSVEAFELEEAPTERRNRLQNRASEFKRRHTRLGRIIDYLHGPRPPIDLPGEYHNSSKSGSSKLTRLYQTPFPF